MKIYVTQRQRFIIVDVYLSCQIAREQFFDQNFLDPAPSSLEVGSLEVSFFFIHS